MNNLEGRSNVASGEEIKPYNNVVKETGVDKEMDSAGDISENEVFVNVEPNQLLSDTSVSKESDTSTATGSKKGKKKFRHGKKGYPPIKELDIRRVHYAGTKFKQGGRKRSQTFPTISKFFLPHKRPRKETFIPPTKFLLGGNISDPLNLNSLQDEDINRAMNAVTPQSSPLPTPPRHKAKIDVIIPPNIRDPLNLMEPLENEEYEKRLEMQQKKQRKKMRRKTTEVTAAPKEVSHVDEKEDTSKSVNEPSVARTGKRSCSESENSQGPKNKDCKKLRRMDSLDKIVSPVVPQPGAWKRVRAPTRPLSSERSPNRIKQRQKSESEDKLPKFDPKNTKYQYGNYDRYYGYRNLNAMMDVRLQVFDMHKHLFYNKDVLDIGCNVGHISMAVAKTYGARSVFGIDIDSQLIERAKKNLRSFIPVPAEGKIEDKKSTDCNKCADSKCDDCNLHGQKLESKLEDKKLVAGRKIKKPKKNRKAHGNSIEGQYYFPKSFSSLFGSLNVCNSQASPPMFPYNVTFKQDNYVPDEMSVGSAAECPQFDLILCLSTTKWIHLNWGDAGLKRAFRKMFADLRPGGKLVLEAQNWSSYKKKKRLTPTIYENFNNIDLFPNKFRDYLLSPEVGFNRYCVLGVPEHTSKGFRRPIYLYIKGDFTPSKASWSDAYAPSSHHRPEMAPPIRTVYAPMEPNWRPSDTMSCGAATPYSATPTRFDLIGNESPFYSARSDTYIGSFAQPKATVYATIPSPVVGGASPAPYRSPAASPASEPRIARVYPIPSPRSTED